MSEIRRATDDDAEAIAAICNAVTRELYGTGDADANEVRSWFTMPDLAALVLERSERIVGYADVRADSDGTRFPIDIRVAPEARGTGVADELLHACEEWARPHAKPGAIARGFTAELDREVADALERGGYALIRHSLHMLAELPDEVAPPDLPAGITLRTFEPEDEEAVYECSQETFEDHWDFQRISLERWRMFMMREGFEPTLWWLAEHDGELAAICLNAWHFSGDPTLGWIGTLGVRKAYRRQGLGLTLLRHSFADFKRLGATRVGLGVDAENTTGAVRLYERAGMRVVRRNDNYEKAL